MGVQSSLTALDDRLGVARGLRRNIRKLFPDHWSFLLGEIALYSLVTLILTGTFLTFWFTPTMGEIVYDGPYQPLRGVSMSQAYASTLDISFEVRGGLLVRQMHHWAALVFVAAIMAHLLRVFFNGAFRKPRELNWMIGVGMLVLAIAEGFTGYSLPDDLLSGTGLRIAQGIVLSIPVAGTYLSALVFGGGFPGDIIISRLYPVHILLIPGLLLALVTAHLMLVWVQKHTQQHGLHRAEDNIVGTPVHPSFAAKSIAFLLFTLAVIAGLATFAQINPVWLYGPYTPANTSSFAQPDWYIGFLEGTLRLMPSLETNVAGHTISWNVLVPAVIFPLLFFTVLAAVPYLYRRFTGDREPHHLADRARDVPTRTGLGVAGITLFGVAWASGAQDAIARYFNLNLFDLVWFFRVALFAAPLLALFVARRVCLGLQLSDHELLDHGVETGVIERAPTGGYYELTTPPRPEDRAKIEYDGRYAVEHDGEVARRPREPARQRSSDSGREH
ncbi:ubiquinol-cytochrome c reductase cytochrome b subunit [Thermopolyspora sp. NPDC052614]|uniref:cytochrome bc1 complex cytochrome b subunit n=1 Tax=Thermopolyspora sp. NPDC052614 TaxID=3155682 RepID=UPI003448AF8B